MVLPAFSKVFERILLTRLMELPQVTEHITQHQFGFWKSHGCPEQIHRLVKHITHGFEHKLYTAKLHGHTAGSPGWYNVIL